MEGWLEAGARGAPGSVPSNKIRGAAEHTFSLIFLTRSLVFPILLFSSISLHCSLKEAFLSLLVILWNLHSDGYVFPFLLCLSHLFSQLFVQPPQITASTTVGKNALEEKE